MKPNQQVLTFVEARNKLNEWIKSSYPEDKQLVWLNSKYLGRIAHIKHVILGSADWCSKDDMRILVRVATERTDGTGYIDDNDDFHRTYHDLEFNFEEIAEESPNHPQPKTMAEEIVTINTFGFGPFGWWTQYSARIK